MIVLFPLLMCGMKIIDVLNKYDIDMFCQDL